MNTRFLLFFGLCTTLLSLSSCEREAHNRGYVISQSQVEKDTNTDTVGDDQLPK